MNQQRLNAAAREVIFEPGPLGLYVADVAGGMVTEVHDGQAAAKGVTPYIKIITLDGEPYTEALMDQKKHGSAPYRLAYQSVPPPDAEIILECVKAMGTVVSQLPQETRRVELALQGGTPTNFGRVHQAATIEHLMPDAELRNCISRSHFSVSMQGQVLTLKRLSVNSIYVDENLVPQGVDFPVHHGAIIGLCSQGDHVALQKSSRKEKDGCVNPLAKMFTFKSEDDEEGQLPFMAFRLLMHKVAGRPFTGEQGHPPYPAQMQAQAAQMPPGPHMPQGPTSPFFLVCTMSLSRDVSQLPGPSKTVQLGNERMALGRQPQAALFEAVLGPDSQHWTAISRSHVEIEAAHGHLGVFLVRNLSPNHVRVGRSTLEKGSQSPLANGESIDFLDATGNSFLRFSLQSPAPPQGQAGMVSQPPAGYSPAGETMAALAPPPGHGQAEADFWVELGGTAVKPEVPHGMRKVYAQPSNGGGVAIVVGQHELHKAALVEQAMTFVSREHFKVEEREESSVNVGWDPFLASSSKSVQKSCHLVNLSGNPIWKRRGHEQVMLNKEESSHLQPGDCILIYTGAPDGTPDGPGCAGTIAWTFCKEGGPDRAY